MLLFLYKLLLLEPLDRGTLIPLRSGIAFYQNLSFRLGKTFTSQDRLRCCNNTFAIHFCAQAWWLSYVAFATLRWNRRFSILLLQISMQNRLGAGRVSSWASLFSPWVLWVASWCPTRRLLGVFGVLYCVFFL